MHSDPDHQPVDSPLAANWLVAQAAESLWKRVQGVDLVAGEVEAVFSRIQEPKSRTAAAATRKSKRRCVWGGGERGVMHVCVG